MTAPTDRRRLGRRPIGRQTALTLVALLASLWALLPIVWVISSALRPREEIFAYLSPLSIHTLVPKQLTTASFGDLFDGPFLTAILNSVVVAAVTVVVGVVICAMAAFALSAFRFPGRGAVFGVIVVSFLIPFDAIAIPLASLFRGWHLQNSYAGLILPGLGNGLAIFLLRQFFLGIPRELAEAARVDGFSWWQIFARIYVPLSRPALIGAGLTLFIFQWQAFLWPLLIVTESDKAVAPTALASLAGQVDVDYGQIFAGAAVIAVIPAVILLFLQRYFTESVATTGGK